MCCIEWHFQLELRLGRNWLCFLGELARRAGEGGSLLTFPFGFNNSSPISIIRVSTSIHRGKAIYIPLPITFAALADPHGTLQPAAAWRTYGLGISPEAQRNLDFENSLNDTVVSDLRKDVDEEEEQRHLSFWSAHLRSVAFRAARELEAHLSAVITDILDPILKDPPASLCASTWFQSALVLNSPRLHPASEVLRMADWMNCDQLRPRLEDSSVAAANCILQLLATQKSSDYILEIVPEGSRRCSSPHMRVSEAWREPGFLVISGECSS